MERENKTILYIPGGGTGYLAYRHVQRFLEGRPYTLLWYYDLSRQEFPERSHLPGVGRNDILKIVKRHSDELDLIVIDGLINRSCKISQKIRGRGIAPKAKILENPIYNRMIDPRMTLADYVADSGADFGINTGGPKEFVRALDNIFAGKTGGYVFNPDLYVERNGVLVPKTK